MKDNLKRLVPSIERELHEAAIRREQDHIERKQKESEERFSKAFHSSVAAFTITGIEDGLIIDVNEAYQHLTGYSRKELVGHKTTEISLWVDLRQREKILQILKAEGKVRNIAVDVRNKNGKVVNTIISMEIIQLHGQDFILSTAVEITMRKKAEEALAEGKERTAELAANEEKYRPLVENANETIAVVQDGLLKFINKRGLEISGYSLEEITDSPFLEIVHPDDRELVADIYRRRMAGKPVPASYELKTILKDNSIRWAQLSGVRITWEGKPAILALLTDITERKQAEEKFTKLSEFRELLTEIATRFINAPAVVLDHEILDAQRRLCEYLDIESSTIFLALPEVSPSLKMTYLYRRQGLPPVPATIISRDFFPWSEQQVRLYREVRISSLDKLPAEAARDAATWLQIGIKSSIILPLQVRGDELLGVFSFGTASREQSWDDDLVNSLKLMAQVFANAIVRKQSEETLQKTQNKLENTFHELEKSNEQLKSYNKKMIQTQEYERELTSQTLNDTIQHLSIMKLEMEGLLAKAQIISPSTDVKLHELYDSTTKALKVVAEKNEKISPDIIEQIGLVEVLQQTIEQFSILNNIPVNFKFNRSDRLNPDCELALFRIAQEALGNIEKHSKASRAEVKLTINPEEVSLTIRDDGQGFDTTRLSSTNITGGINLRMTEWARHVGALLNVTSLIGNGTTVSVKAQCKIRTEGFKGNYLG